MRQNLEIEIEAFLRSHLEDFTCKDLLLHLKQRQIQATQQDVLPYLLQNPLVYCVDDKKFCSKPGIFSFRLFSIKPTKMEIENKILITGHRCIPFADPEMIPSYIKYISEIGEIPQKVVELPTISVRPLYKYCGEEFIPQLIAYDPANEALNLSNNDFELPPIINITANDMSEFYEKVDFKYGDRLLAAVVDWNEGVVLIEHVSCSKDNIFEETKEDKIRKEWAIQFECAMSTNFDLNGPCASIDEQIENVFLSDIKELCIPEAASFEEVLDSSDLIDIVDYGVETRLWRKDEEIPAYGPWSDKDFAENQPTNIENTFSLGNLAVPEFIIDSYVYDSLFLKEENPKNILGRIAPSSIILKQREQKALLLKIQSKYDSIKESFNWFADYPVGEVRHSALQIYTKLFILLGEIESANLDLDKVPQQELVILSQLIGHLTKLISSFTNENIMTEKTLEAITASLDGMNMSFEEVDLIIRQEIKEHQKNKLKLSKNSED